MPARSTTTAGKIKLNLALDPSAYELLRQLAGTDRGLGSLLNGLIFAEARRRQEEADVVARMRSGGGNGSQLQQALARLEESEARYDRLVDRMSAVVFELTPDGQTLFVNQAITDLTGFSREELAGQGWRSLLFAGDLSHVPDEHFRILRQGDIHGHEVAVATKFGRRVILEITTANRYAPDGTLEHILGFAVDVTKRWLVQQEARSQREVALQAAAQAEEMAAQKEAALAELAAAHARLARREAELSESAAGLREAAATLEGRVRERTAQLQETAEQLERERNLFQAILQQMPSGVIIAEAPTGRIVLANDQMERIQRRPLWGAGGVAEYGQGQGFHPDGRPYETDEWPLARVLQYDQPVSNEEIQLASGDGAPCIIRVSAVPVRNAAGEIIAGVAVSADITQQRQLEASLREARTAQQEALRAVTLSEVRYRAALQKAGVLVYQADRDLRYTWVGNLDPDFGFAGEQIIGKRDDELLPAEDVAELLAVKRSVIATGRGRRGRIRIGRGERLALYDYVAEPVCADSGEVVGLSVVAWAATGPSAFNTP